MIEKIKIKNFGKFKNIEFQFAPVTVFFGKNESGKTTLFDAIFTAISKIDRKTDEGKRLNRYGEAKNLSIELEPEIKKISSDIFLNVFAIRSGEITLNFGKKDFVNEVMERILSSNVNLGELMKNVSQIAHTDSRNSFYKGKKVLEESILELNSKIGELKGRVEKYENTEKLIKKDNERINNLKSEIETLKEKLKKVEENIKNLENSKEFKILNDTYNEFQSFCKKQEELKELEWIDNEELDELKNKTETLQRLKIEMENLNKSISTKSEKIKSLEEEKGNSERQLLKIEGLFPVLLNLKIFGIFFIVFLLMAFLSSASIFIFLENLTITLIVSISASVFLILAIFFYIFYRITRKKIFLALPEVNSKKIKEIFKNLQKDKEKINLKLTEYISFEIERLKGEIEKEKETLRNYSNEIEFLNKEKENYLNKKRVQSLEELIKRNERFKILKDEVDKLKEKFEKIANDYNTDINGLDNLLRRKLRDFEEMGISAKTYDEAELKRNLSEKKTLEERLKTLEDEKNNLEQKLSEKKGELTNLSTIVSELKEKERELEKKQNELKDMEKKILAYTKIYDILNLIDKDTFYKFKSISDEISREFSSFFPQLRNVDFGSLEKMEFSIEDGQKEKRKFEFLSRGTQDMFLLAFRILLAKRFGIFEKEGFLIFDEAFLSLDHERIEKMVKLLRKFFDENGWQLIFFTKEEYLKDLLLKTFKDEIKVNILENIA